jgi:hypothetical protein
MDMAEAQALLQHELARLRALPYAELMGLSQARQERGASGAEYNIEIEAFFDDPRRKQDLRVMVSVDDGRWPHAFRPLTGDFVIAPDGSFVGE